MKKNVSRSALLVVVGLMLTGLLAIAPLAAQDGPLSLSGLEISIDRLERARLVPLGDCPLGENIVNGVIKYDDTGSEFVTVHLNFKVLPDFAPVNWPRPAIHDVNGQAYRTAQTFGEMNREPTFSCNFSFRVPIGMKVKEMLIDDETLDLTAFDL